MERLKAGLLCLMLCCVPASGSQGIAHADTQPPSIQVPAIVKVEAGAELPIPVQIVPPNAVPPQAMLLIRGIPASASLNSGRHFPSGVWAVKPSAVPKLRIASPAEASEDVHLIFSLVTLDGEYISNVLARLIIAPPGSATGKAPEVIASIRIGPEEEPRPEGVPGSEPPAPVPPAAQPTEKRPPLRVLVFEDVNKIIKLMQKGDQYLYEGKIVAARRFYEYAAEMGWPDGAAAIARTYDPTHLKRFPILGGIRPDTQLAQQWYDKSRILAAQLKIDDATRIGQR
jgi:hypothetical protein